MGKPQGSTLGLLVKSTTMSTGTKKIRSTVREFGRFIIERARRPFSRLPEPFGHYRLRI
jgi:hypothetical protein